MRRRAESGIAAISTAQAWEQAVQHTVATVSECTTSCASSWPHFGHRIESVGSGAPFAFGIRQLP